MAGLLSYARLRQAVDKMTVRRNLEIRQTLAGVGAHDAGLGQGGARSFMQKAPKPSGNQALGNESMVTSSPSQRYYIVLIVYVYFIEAVPRSRKAKRSSSGSRRVVPECD